MRGEGWEYVWSSWPIQIGLHTCYNGNYKEKRLRENKQNFKNYLSSDCFLQYENMK